MASSELAAALQTRRDMASGALWASHICSDIWLGRGRDAQNIEKLREIGITHILNVADDVPNYHEGLKMFTYCSLKVADFGQEVGGIGKHFGKAFQFLQQSGVRGERIDVSDDVSSREDVADDRREESYASGKVDFEPGPSTPEEVVAAPGEPRPRPRLLIHCANGSNRSCTVMIAMMMMLHKLTLKEAYQYVKAKRPSCVPLKDNRAELIKFEAKRYHGDTTMGERDFFR